MTTKWAIWWLFRTDWDATTFLNRLLIRYVGRGYVRAPHRWTWRVEWVPADKWIGIFHRTTYNPATVRQDVYICVIPCFPLHISRFVWVRKETAT